MSDIAEHFNRERSYSDLLRELCRKEKGDWWSSSATVSSDLLRCVNHVHAHMRNQRTGEERVFSFETDDYGKTMEDLVPTDEIVAKFRMEFSE